MKNKMKVILMLGVLANVSGDLSQTSVLLGAQGVEFSSLKNMNAADVEYNSFLSDSITNITSIGTTYNGQTIWEDDAMHRYNPQRHVLAMLQAAAEDENDANTLTIGELPNDFLAATYNMLPLYDADYLDLTHYARKTNDISNNKPFYAADLRKDLSIRVTGLKDSNNNDYDAKYTLTKGEIKKTDGNNDETLTYSDPFNSFLSGLALAKRSAGQETEKKDVFLSLWASLIETYGDVNATFDFKDIVSVYERITDESVKQRLIKAGMAKYTQYTDITSKLQSKYNDLGLLTADVATGNALDIDTIYTIINNLRDILGIKQGSITTHESWLSVLVAAIKEKLGSTTTNNNNNTTTETLSIDTMQELWKQLIPNDSDEKLVKVIQTLIQLYNKVNADDFVGLTSFAYNDSHSDPAVSKIINNMTVLVNALSSATRPKTIDDWQAVTSEELKKYPGLKNIVKNQRILRDAITNVSSDITKITEEGSSPLYSAMYILHDNLMNFKKDASNNFVAPDKSPIGYDMNGVVTELQDLLSNYSLIENHLLTIPNEEWTKNPTNPTQELWKTQSTAFTAPALVKYNSLREKVNAWKAAIDTYVSGGSIDWSGFTEPTMTTPYSSFAELRNMTNNINRVLEEIKTSGTTSTAVDNWSTNDIVSATSESTEYKTNMLDLVHKAYRLKQVFSAKTVVGLKTALTESTGALSAALTNANYATINGWRDNDVDWPESVVNYPEVVLYYEQLTALRDSLQAFADKQDDGDELDWSKLASASWEKLTLTGWDDTHNMMVWEKDPSNT